jgi:hypothetical protein
MVDERCRQEAADKLRNEAVKTRLKMLSFLAENRIAILAYHFAWPGYGHFVKQGEGFRYLRGHEHEPLVGCTRGESRSENADGYA